MDKTINQCLLCDGKTEMIFDLGEQPPANALKNSPNTFVRCARLAAQMCTQCTHVMQKVSYNTKELFDHYLYVSGTSNTLNDYFEWFAENVSLHHPNADVLEIASNDGTLLQKLAKRGATVTGIEPAKNLLELSSKKGVYTIPAYWPLNMGNERYDVVIAMNVLAHNDDPIAFLKGIEACLTDDGVAYIQVSQMDMLANGEFDTIYHEHVSFFTVDSFTLACARAGLRVGFRQRVNVHGGSMLAAVCKRDSFPSPIPFAPSQWNEGRLHQLTWMDGQRFANGVNRAVESMRSVIKQAKSDGYVVVMVGCAAKAVTLMQAINDDPHVVVDESPLKIGKYLPNSTQQIVALQTVSEIRQKCLFILGAWNFKQELIRKLQELRDPYLYDSVLTPFPMTFKESLHG
jgi:SAM-dependent methyltransferase